VFLNLGLPSINPAAKIFNTTINHNLFSTIVQLNVTDTYLNHADPDTPNLAIFKTNLGLALQCIRSINNLDWSLQVMDNAPAADQRGGLLRRLNELVDLLPGTDTLNDFTLTTTDDIFFETLCFNLRNEILGFQGWLKKLENAKLNKIFNTLNILKPDYLQNSEEIAQLEASATLIHDNNLSSKVSEMKIFENLNFEKPTPIFLTLTKNLSSEKLSLIKNDNGAVFNTESARHKFIVDSYEKIYRDRDPPHIPDNVVENFLGDDVVNSPLVQNSLLTEDESSWLDRPLTLAELDLSAKKGKIRSAPGADGFSNRIISACWKFFRYPLYKYAIFC
jgi:hypothetical protein